MPAYVISEVRILDQDLIEKYGGRYLVRSGAVDLVEGDGDRDRQYIIVEFPDMARAREWYHSPEYAEALKFRFAALDRTLVFAEGVE